jgi:hypothetical protein
VDKNEPDFIKWLKLTMIKLLQILLHNKILTKITFLVIIFTDVENKAIEFKKEKMGKVEAKKPDNR